jgi:hypothetical protein
MDVMSFIIDYHQLFYISNNIFKLYFTDKEFREYIVKRIFNLVLKKYHPDKGGDEEVFKTLNNLWDKFTK